MLKRYIFFSVISYVAITSSIFASENGQITNIREISTEDLAITLEEAIDNNNISVIQAIMRDPRANNVFAIALREAVESENLSTVRDILHYRAGEDAFHTANANDEYYPLLCHAAQKTNLRLFRLLIEIGRDYINDTDEYGDTPLILATATYASQESYEIIKILIDMDADTEVKGEDDLTALKAAYNTFSHYQTTSNLEKDIISLLVLNSNISDPHYYDDNFLDNLLEFGLSDLAISKINEEKRKRKKRKYYNEHHNNKENNNPDYGPDTGDDGSSLGGSDDSSIGRNDSDDEGSSSSKRRRTRRLILPRVFSKGIEINPINKINSKLHPTTQSLPSFKVKTPYFSLRHCPY